MQVILHTTPAMAIASKGKKLRDKNDVYKEAYIDEEGNEIPEYLPHYTDVIFIPSSLTEEQVKELYVEEEVEEVEEIE